MTAGMNMLFSIVRMNEDSDDYVGGVSITGTVVYQNVMGRMQGFSPDQIFEAQGIETTKTFSFLFVPVTMDIRERDEAEVSAPFDHHYYGDRFRLTGIRYSDHNPRDPRAYLTAVGSRSERAHDIQ